MVVLEVFCAHGLSQSVKALGGPAGQNSPLGSAWMNRATVWRASTACGLSSHPVGTPPPGGVEGHLGAGHSVENGLRGWGGGGVVEVDERVAVYGLREAWAL